MNGVAAVEQQHGVVGDIAASQRAARASIADLQRTESGNCRRSVRIAARKGQRVRASWASDPADNVVSDHGVTPQSKTSEPSSVTPPVPSEPVPLPSPICSVALAPMVVAPL